MATIGTISAALQLVDGKKENLRKVFEDLQSQSHSLSSFNLTWSDLDSYFSSLQSSLEHKLKLLQSIEPQSPSPKQSPSTAVPARPEVKAFCEKMDGVGLLRYLIDSRLGRAATKVELRDAYKSAPDVAAMVLDAMEMFYPTDKDLDLNLNKVRISCLVMLEESLRMKPELSDEVREKATKLAIQWKESMARLDGEKPSEILGFLHLVAVYNLDGFDMDELIDYVISISKRKQAVDLCRSVIPADRITDLIQKLIDNGEKLVAVKFSYEFKKTDKFPLVPLLKEYRQETRKSSRKIRNSGKSSLQALNEASNKDISSLRSIIKCIDDYHLESEYPKDTLVGLLEKLEKDKENKKRRAQTPPLPKQDKPKTRKHPQTAAPSRQEITSKSYSNVYLSQQPQVQSAAGLLPDRSAHYANQAGPIFVAGPSNAIPYTGSNASPYGYVGGPSGNSGNLTSGGSHLYPSELQTPPSGYYNVPVPYGGYNLQPQYHPSYYPQ